MKIRTLMILIFFYLTNINYAQTKDKSNFEDLHEEGEFWYYDNPYDVFSLNKSQIGLLGKVKKIIVSKTSRENRVEEIQNIFFNKNGNISKYTYNDYSSKYITNYFYDESDRYKKIVKSRLYDLKIDYEEELSFTYKKHNLVKTDFYTKFNYNKEKILVNRNIFSYNDKNEIINKIFYQDLNGSLDKIGYSKYSHNINDTIITQENYLKDKTCFKYIKYKTPEGNIIINNLYYNNCSLKENILKNLKYSSGKLVSKTVDCNGYIYEYDSNNQLLEIKSKLDESLNTKFEYILDENKNWIQRTATVNSYVDASKKSIEQYKIFFYRKIEYYK